MLYAQNQIIHESPHLICKWDYLSTFFLNYGCFSNTFFIKLVLHHREVMRQKLRVDFRRGKPWKSINTSFLASVVMFDMFLPIYLIIKHWNFLHINFTNIVTITIRKQDDHHETIRHDNIENTWRHIDNQFHNAYNYCDTMCPTGHEQTHMFPYTHCDTAHICIRSVEQIDKENKISTCTIDRRTSVFSTSSGIVARISISSGKNATQTIVSCFSFEFVCELLILWIYFFI